MKLLPSFRRETVFDRIAYVSALEIPPGAVLVAKSSQRLSVEQATALEKQVKKAFPGRKVLVLPPEIELDVVREVDS